jgi:hypothetical protein
VFREEKGKKIKEKEKSFWINYLLERLLEQFVLPWRQLRDPVGVQ